MGVYAGYNYGIAPSFVTGVEGDLAADFGGSKSMAGIPGALLSFNNGAGPLDDEISARGPSYGGSLRARLGALLTPSVLPYGTGGLAFADSKYTINCPATANSWRIDP